MNLLEHYIKEIYSAKNITEDFKKNVGHSPCRLMVKVKMKIDCYGVIADTEHIFLVDEWEDAKKQGYYMA